MMHEHEHVCGIVVAMNMAVMAWVHVACMVHEHACGARHEGMLAWHRRWL
jgi:hypothetical protein